MAGRLQRLQPLQHGAIHTLLKYSKMLHHPSVVYPGRGRPWQALLARPRLRVPWQPAQGDDRSKLAKVLPLPQHAHDEQHAHDADHAAEGNNVASPAGHHRCCGRFICWAGGGMGG